MGFENGKMLRCVLKAQKGQDVQVNIVHYDLDDGIAGEDNDPQTLADLLRDQVMIKQRLLYDATWTIQPVEITQEKDPLAPNAARQSWVSGTAITGSKSDPGSTAREPRAMCVVATVMTEHIGRRHRGRKYVGGSWGEGEQTDGNWESTALTLVSNYLNSFPLQPDIATGTSDATAKLCVYSRTARALNQNPYASKVTAFVPRSPVHWLRSREA